MLATLLIAARWGHEGIVKLLLESPDIKAQARDGSRRIPLCRWQLKLDMRR